MSEALAVEASRRVASEDATDGTIRFRSGSRLEVSAVLDAIGPTIVREVDARAWRQVDDVVRCRVGQGDCTWVEFRAVGPWQVRVSVGHSTRPAPNPGGWVWLESLTVRRDRIGEAVAVCHADTRNPLFDE